MTFPGILNQDAIWHKTTGKNVYNEPVSTPISIKVRWEDRKRVIRNKKGETVQSQGFVLCLEPVTEEDYLEFNERKWPIALVDDPPDINGKVTLREVYV